jgi:hypothetical protein
MKFRFIASEKAHHALTLLCRCLRVTRSGFYAWQRRPESARAKRDRQLKVLVHASFAAPAKAATAVRGFTRTWTRAAPARAKLPADPRRARHHGQHEPARRLLRQRGHGEPPPLSRASAPIGSTASWRPRWSCSTTSRCSTTSGADTRRSATSVRRVRTTRFGVTYVCAVACRLEKSRPRQSSESRDRPYTAYFSRNRKSRRWREGRTGGRSEEGTSNWASAQKGAGPGPLSVNVALARVVLIRARSTRRSLREIG